MVRECGMDMDTRLCLTRRTCQGLLDSTGTSAQSSVMTGEGTVREFEMDTGTLLCLTQRTGKELLPSTGTPARCHAAAWMGGDPGQNKHMYSVFESICCLSETITTLLID